MRIIVHILFLFLVGCANIAPMAVDKQTKKLDVSSKSIVLMTVDFARPEPSRYIPHPLWVDFNKKDSSGKTERLVFQVDKDAGSFPSELHNKFLLRIPLSPGNYEMTSIFGAASAFPFIGFFRLPLLMNVDIPANSVTYVGRVNALLRPRIGEEFRAGSIIPLIDQAATGISGNTFDVTIQDMSQEEISEFKMTFPILADVEIQKVILPSFDKHKAQVWWETDGKGK